MKRRELIKSTMAYNVEKAIKLLEQTVVGLEKRLEKLEGEHASLVGILKEKDMLAR